MPKLRKSLVKRWSERTKLQPFRTGKHSEGEVPVDKKVIVKRRKVERHNKKKGRKQ